MNNDLFKDFSAVLKVRGWSIKETNPNGADLWSLNDGTEMYLPKELKLGSFVWSDLVKRVAYAHNANVAKIEQEVEFIRCDITRFRIDDVSSDDSTVSLEAGASVITSAFGMLRAAATAARRPRQTIGGSYSKLGDEIVSEARLAHTEKGSFVFPVALKISEAPISEEVELDGASSYFMPPESPERRVMRTLAQAMDAFDKHVIKPGKDPQRPALDQFVIAGGTKELLWYVSKTLTEPGVSWFETGFEWSPIENIDTESPSRVVIPADNEARELVARSVKLLSVPKRDTMQVFTGPIIHISHAPEDLFGEIAIQTPVHGSSRLGRIELRVRREQLSDIHDWMKTGKTVVVQGTVSRAPGRPARLESSTKPSLLENAMLFSQDEN